MTEFCWPVLPDPLFQAVRGHAQTLGHFLDWVAPLGDLPNCFIFNSGEYLWLLIDSSFRLNYSLRSV